MSDMPVSNNVQTPPSSTKKKLNPAAKGAIVGGSIATGLQLVSNGILKSLDKDIFESAIKATGGKAKYYGKCAFAIAAWAGIGAAINAFRHRDDE